MRPAAASDLAAIRAVGEAAWPETYAFAGPAYIAHGLATWWSEEAVRRGLTTTETLVAETSGQVVGMGNVDLRSQVPVIWKLYVLPGHQGTGVGSRLLTSLVGLVPRDRTAVALEYVDGNDRAAAFYARHGFIETRRQPAEVPGWPDQVWVERSLTVS